VSRLDWRPGAFGNETCVWCCGCHAQIAVAESRAAPTGARRALHSCCTECEERYEAANPEAVTRAIAAVEAARLAYWDSPERTWNR
jgi:hypothetical protein